MDKLMSMRGDNFQRRTLREWITRKPRVCAFDVRPPVGAEIGDVYRNERTSEVMFVASKDGFARGWGAVNMQPVRPGDLFYRIGNALRENQ